MKVNKKYNQIYIDNANKYIELMRKEWRKSFDKGKIWDELELVTKLKILKDSSVHRPWRISEFGGAEVFWVSEGRHSGAGAWPWPR